MNAKEARKISIEANEEINTKTINEIHETINENAKKGIFHYCFYTCTLHHSVIKYYKEILGQTALRDIERGTPLSFEMIGK